MSNWKQVVALSEIPPLGARVFRTEAAGEALEIAVFRTRDDQVFALHNACPHQGGVLSEGIVHGHRVTCPLHNWVISLEDGSAQGTDTGRTGCFATKIEAGMVFVKV